MSDPKDEKKKAAEPRENAQPDHSNALVIRDGFPALLLVPKASDAAGTEKQQQKKWNVDETDETMSLPRHTVWSHDDALLFNHDMLDILVKDCEKVFTARTRDDEAAYSAGTTYFLPAKMKPRCALEGLVQQIFQQHVALLDDPGMYKPAESGAEWWTLVMGDDENDMNNDTKSNTHKTSGEENSGDEDGEEDEEDEVGWHYDADYGLEDQAPGLLLHPRVATVTYLSNEGAPTVILDCKTPHQGNVKALDGQKISHAWVSYPRVGKHLAFDGRLLHGAPAAVFPSLQTLSAPIAKSTEEKGEEPPAKRAKTNPAEKETQKPLVCKNDNKQRVTLLVNVWLNHCPLDAELLDDDVVEQMESPWTPPTTKPKTSAAAPTQTNSKDVKTAEETITSAAAPGTVEKQALFRWNTEIRMADPPKLHPAKIVLPPPPTAASNKEDEEEDFEDDIVICNHRVSVHYGTTLEDYHLVAHSLLQDKYTITGNIIKDNNAATSGSKSSTLAVDLGHGALSLRVGEPVSSDDEDDGGEEK